MKNWVAVAVGSWNLGYLYLELGRQEEGMPLVYKAVDIWKQLGHVPPQVRHMVPKEWLE